MKIHRGIPMLLAALALAMAVAGCASPVDQVVKNDEMRGQMMDKISGNAAMTVDLMKRLLGSEESQGIVLDQVLSNTDATQSLMLRMAKDQTMVDGILNTAMQDPAMREHLVTLFKGVQMAGGK